VSDAMIGLVEEAVVEYEEHLGEVGNRFAVLGMVRVGDAQCEVRVEDEAAWWWVDAVKDV